MQVLAKFVVSALVFLAVYPFTFWLFFVQILPLSLVLVAQLAALATGLGAAVWTWRAMRSGGRGILTIAACWAVVAGALAFCAGFFGPMIFAPGANQGPLLGLFVTGPLGFIGGGVAGLIYALCRPARDPAVF
jgi:hypothetical protein